MFKKYLVLMLMILVAGFSATVFAAPRGVLFDYFGTGRSDFLDISLIPLSQQISARSWNILRNPVTSPPQIRRVTWGLVDVEKGIPDLPVFGDYDGDGKNDIGVYRINESNPQNYFYIQRSANPNPSAIYSQPWGSALAGDLPYVAGDFDGDNKDDFAVVREENGAFSHYILPSAGGNFRRIVFGLPSDFPSYGGADFTGDRRDEIAVARLDESNGQINFFAGDSVTGNQVFAGQWGTVNGYEAVSIANGDYIGDSRADLIAIYGACGGCANEGTWWIKETGGSGVRVVKFGIPLNAEFEGDLPLFDVDYDGDGKLDIAVRRWSNNTYYWLRSSDGQIGTQYWDGNSATPPGTSVNLFENALEPRGESIPAGALKGLVVAKQPDGAYKMERASDFYLKNKNVSCISVINHRSLF